MVGVDDAPAPVRVEVGLVAEDHLASGHGEALPLALHPVGEDALGVGDGDGRGALGGAVLVLFEGPQLLVVLLQVEGLVAVLGGVEVVHAGRVAGQGDVGDARVGILFEDLKRREKTLKRGRKYIS